MRRISALALAFTLILISSPYGTAATMDHMKDHMGGGMGKMDEERPAQAQNKLSQDAEASGVTAKVTYKNPGEKSPVFEVALDTHSVDLEQYKFEDIIVLRDERGDELRPELISSSGSGHHRSAVVQFKDTDASAASSVELVIKNVGGVDERVFSFWLK